MPIKQLKIRSAVQSDIDILISLRAYLLDGTEGVGYSSRNAEESHRWKAAYRLWLSQVLETDDRTQIIVAENDGEVVGCATGIIDRRAPAPDCMSGWCGYVQSMVVLPLWRRMGIAERLMHELLQWFFMMKVTKVVLESTQVAEALYQKLGFSPHSERLFSLSGGRP
ncbi:GNAT family N-acetyltransferase [Klebsiella oxytoca]|uniref:GNAT family N-acetyltransferase n=1 Tax=Klebsiella oxytoca TaxID=571 RepID=UPI0029319EDC|nr:GNAT family N-acetyltransferase [Klebsiella oxytoca]